MRRIRYFLLLLTAWYGLALAGGSTINTTVPAPNSLISSAPIRANFAAAYSDINTLFGQSNGAVPPVLPLLGQLWLNISGTPYALEEWDGNQWVVTAYLNASTHVWSEPATSLPLGTSINNPGTGAIEALLPVQSVTQTSRIYSTADFFRKTRRSNAGVTMTDTLPSATATGLTNGTQINIVNADASAIDTVSAGAGTTIDGNAIFVIEPGRDMWWTYDAANTTWRPVANTGSSVLYTGIAPGASQIWGGSLVPGSAASLSLGACLGISSGVISDTCDGTITGPASTTLGYVPLWSNATGTQVGAGLPVAQSGNTVLVETTPTGTIAPAIIPAPTSSTFGGVKSYSAAVNSFLTGIGSNGIPTSAQPSFSNFSGYAACSQMPSLTGAVTMSTGSCATAIAPTGVVPGGYTNVNITVGTDGRITAISNGSGSAFPSNLITETSNYTANAGDNINADTSGGAFTVLLPASPLEYNTVCVNDATGSFGTSMLTIGANGNKIMGQSTNMTVTSPYVSFCLMYYNSTNGWRIK